MSKLKAYIVYTPMDETAIGMQEDMRESDVNIEGKEVYLKSEVDKVIKTKDAILADMNSELVRRSEVIAGLECKVALLHRECIRHKYKRCLAMARCCWAVEELNRYGDQDYMDFAKKWCKRWLELAEKFKAKMGGTK